MTEFDALVKRHNNTMHRIALRIVRDPVEAEDVVQEAWLSAWRAAGTFHSSAWLYRVVTNAALGHLRRRKVTVPLEVEQVVAHGPECSAVRNEAIGAVLRDIAALEPSQRVPLVLHDLEGMSYEEVAHVLGIGVDAVRARLHRARVALRRNSSRGGRMAPWTCH